MQTLHTWEPQKRNWEESIQGRYFKTWGKKKKKMDQPKRGAGHSIKCHHGIVLSRHSIYTLKWTFSLETPKNSDFFSSSGQFAAGVSVSFALLSISLGVCSLSLSKQHQGGGSKKPSQQKEPLRSQTQGCWEYRKTKSAATGECSLEKRDDALWAFPGHHFYIHSQTEWAMIEAEGSPVIIRQTLRKSTTLF